MSVTATRGQHCASAWCTAVCHALIAPGLSSKNSHCTQEEPSVLTHYTVNSGRTNSDRIITLYWFWTQHTLIGTQPCVLTHNTSNGVRTIVLTHNTTYTNKDRTITLYWLTTQHTLIWTEPCVLTHNTTYTNKCRPNSDRTIVLYWLRKQHTLIGSELYLLNNTKRTIVCLFVCCFTS